MHSPSDVLVKLFHVLLVKSFAINKSSEQKDGRTLLFQSSLLSALESIESISSLHKSPPPKIFIVHCKQTCELVLLEWKTMEEELI